MTAKKPTVGRSDGSLSQPESPANQAKIEALFGVLHSIERSYGKGTIQKLGENSGWFVL